MPSINLSGIISGSGVSGRLSGSAQIGGVSVGAAVSIRSSTPTVGLSMSRNTISPSVSGSGSKVSDPNEYAALARTAGLRSRKSGSVKRGKAGSNIMFPHDLDDQHYMTFRVVETHRKNLIDTTKQMKVRSIILPIPGNLVAKYAADYENSDMGALGALASGSMKMADLKAAGNSAKDALKDMGSKIKDAVKAGKPTEGQKEVGTAGAVAAAGGLLGAAAFGGLIGAGAGAIGAANVTKGIGKRLGLAINPHMAVLFKGVGFKEHTFTFKFIPRTQKESEDIQELCRVFRYHMLPEYVAGSLAFGYPDEFQITFSKHLSPYLFDIGNCVLKSFDVTYNGGGVPSFSKDGAPMEIDISLGFQEINIETRNNSSKSTSTMMMASGFGPGKDGRPPVWFAGAGF